MSRKQDIKNYKGELIPDKVKSLTPRGRKEEKLSNWQGTSDREESLSDPRWHKRPPVTKKKQTITKSASSTKNVKDSRELLSSLRPVENFSKTIFNEETTKKRRSTYSE